MDHISKIRTNLNNVNVVNNFTNVDDEEALRKIREAVDKPKTTGQILAERLDAPQNTKFYIQLAYKYSTVTLFTCLHLTEEAEREGLIHTDKARYFYGIVRRQK